MASKAKKTKTKNGIYKLGDSWYVSIVINGKLRRKSCGPNRMTAEAVLAKMKEERAIHKITGETHGLEHLFKKKERKTFKQAAEDYMSERPHLAESTKRGYAEVLKNRLYPVFGEMFVDQITEKMVSDFQARLGEEVSATRTNNVMGPLRYILKVCERRKLLTDNPTTNVKPLEEEETDIDPLNADELEKALSAMPLYLRPIFTCLAWTAARPAEMFALRWSDIDFERGELFIKKGRVRGAEGKTKTKSGTRTIKMLSIVKKTLLALKQNRTQHLSGYVFLNKHGQPYKRHIDREWRLALKKAGLRHRPSYQLRHTFASLCLQNGVQPTWVAKVLGHSSAQITFKHYARFIDDASGFNENRLEEYLQTRSITAEKNNAEECG